MNPILLLIETATEVCSVALTKGNRVLATIYSEAGNTHAEKLFLFIDDVLKQSKLLIKDIDAVAVSFGPGSYTGLRIGLSAAKGICFAQNIPLIRIDTLQSIVFGAKAKVKCDESLLFCPMIDARRMEVYTALYDPNGKIINEIVAKIIDETSFAEDLKLNKIIFCGNGMLKCKSLFENNPKASFINTPLRAENMLQPALNKFENQQFEDIAYCEPNYVKEYQAKKSARGNMFAHLTIIFALGLLSLIPFSCNKNRHTGVIHTSQKQAEDIDPFVVGNQKIVALEEEETELFLKRHPWKMTKTQTGLRYEILKEGTGKTIEDNENLVLNYEVVALSGETLYTFEDIGSHQITVGKSEEISGLYETVKLMKVGGEARIIIPSHLAYGASGDGDKIQPYQTIIMKIKIKDNK